MSDSKNSPLAMPHQGLSRPLRVTSISPGMHMTRKCFWCNKSVGCASGRLRLLSPRAKIKQFACFGCFPNAPAQDLPAAA